MYKVGQFVQDIHDWGYVYKIIQIENNKCLILNVGISEKPTWCSFDVLAKHTKQLNPAYGTPLFEAINE